MDKNHRLSPLENLAVLHCLKLYFSGLKSILFSPEYQKAIVSDLIYLKYQKTILSDLIIPINPNKKKLDFWTITEDLFFRPFKTLVFWSKIYSFLSRIPRNDLFEHNFFKTLMRKSFNFGQKPWTNLLGKGRFFGAPLKCSLSGLKIIRFYPKYQKNHLFRLDYTIKAKWKEVQFWNKKPWIIPLEKCLFFDTFKKVSFLV